jgi:hypothetical protein
VRASSQGRHVRVKLVLATVCARVKCARVQCHGFAVPCKRPDSGLGVFHTYPRVRLPEDAKIAGPMDTEN